MAYKAYVTADYYRNVYQGKAIPAEDQERILRQASRHIDSVTYNRIMERGLEQLTEFQQEIIRETVCRQAEFEYENADELDMILSGYSINGVSVQFGNSWSVFTEKGVAMKMDVYALLCQTGLCCRRLR